MAYTDDIVLISPSTEKLRTLLNVFTDSVDALQLFLNVNKAKVMVFKKQNGKIQISLSMLLVQS